MTRYVSFTTYAALAGLSRQTVEGRVKRGVLLQAETHRKADGTSYQVLNVEQYPPDQQPPAKKTGRPRTKR